MSKPITRICMWTAPGVRDRRAPAAMMMARRCRGAGAVHPINGRFREECLDQSWFTSLPEARRVIEAWRLDYNEHRPHTSPRMRTPAAFAAARPFAKPQRLQPATNAASFDVVAALTASVLSGGSGFS